MKGVNDSQLFMLGDSWPVGLMGIRKTVWEWLSPIHLLVRSECYCEGGVEGGD